jgi:L-asparagine transporter-like permease
MLEKLREFIRPLGNAAMLGLILLGALAAGVLEAWQPGGGAAFTRGVGGFLKSLPQEFYQLAGAGFLGYIAARAHEKGKTIAAAGPAGPDSRATPDSPEDEV